MTWQCHSSDVLFQSNYPKNFPNQVSINMFTHTDTLMAGGLSTQCQQCLPGTHTHRITPMEQSSETVYQSSVFNHQLLISV